MGLKFTKAALHYTRQSDLTANEAHLLLILADHKNDATFVCSPSVATLAAETRMNERTVQRTLRSLENRGLVQVRKRRNKSSLYTLHIPLEQACPVDQPDLFGDDQTPMQNGNRGGPVSPPEVAQCHPNSKKPEDSYKPSTCSKTSSRARTRERPPVEYRFEGQIIRLTERDYFRWCEEFPRLDVWAELQGIDAWLLRKGETKFPFGRVRAMLQRKYEALPEAYAAYCDEDDLADSPPSHRSAM